MRSWPKKNWKKPESEKKKFCSSWWIEPRYRFSEPSDTFCPNGDLRKSSKRRNQGNRSNILQSEFNCSITQKEVDVADRCEGNVEMISLPYQFACVYRVYPHTPFSHLFSISVCVNKFSICHVSYKFCLPPNASSLCASFSINALQNLITFSVCFKFLVSEHQFGLDRIRLFKNWFFWLDENGKSSIRFLIKLQIGIAVSSHTRLSDIS